MIKVEGQRGEQCSSVHDQFRSACKFISPDTYIHTKSSGGARPLTKKTTSLPSFPDSQGLGVVKVLYRWTLNRQRHQNVQLTFQQAIAELCFQPCVCVCMLGHVYMLAIENYYIQMYIERVCVKVAQPSCDMITHVAAFIIGLAVVVLQ